uniref:Uncharacterized protein n=1 Tax=Romanomermis culicivorax TaxID=13658 RepID=A0A915ITW4_ROMCU
MIGVEDASILNVKKWDSGRQKTRVCKEIIGWTGTKTGWKWACLPVEKLAGLIGGNAQKILCHFKFFGAKNHSGPAQKKH